MARFVMVLFGATLLTAACGGQSGAPSDTNSGNQGGAGGAPSDMNSGHQGGAGGQGNTGGAGGALPSDLFVTMQDAAGNETVFRLDNHVVASCANRLSALIEPGCPRLSMFFDVRGDNLPINRIELYVQGAYGFVMRSDGVLHNRTVSDIAIEGVDQQIVTGHYRMTLDEAPGPATDIWGQFALCAESGSTVEPCRNM